MNEKGEKVIRPYKNLEILSRKTYGERAAAKAEAVLLVAILVMKAMFNEDAWKEGEFGLRAF